MKLVVAAVFVGLALVVALAATDLTGDWVVDFAFDDASLAGGGIDCTFKQNAEQVTGDCGAGAVTGELKGRTITWRLRAGNPRVTTTFTGTVDEAGRSMKGRFTRADKGGTFTAARQ
jgi:hypothetical protein